MGETETRIRNLGLNLPARNRKGTGVVDAVLQNGLLFLSAHGPVDENGKPAYVGKVGTDLTLEEGYQAARICGLNTLATIKEYLGSLDRVHCFIKVLGLVNSGADFSEQPAVVNGFSDLMVEVFGVRGQHARSAMGAFVLPQNLPVMIDAILSVRV